MREKERVGEREGESRYERRRESVREKERVGMREGEIRCERRRESI